MWRRHLPAEATQLLHSAALLRQRFERARLGHSKLSGTKAALEVRQNALVKKVGLAKGRLSLVEETDAALEGMQKLVHQRSVGVFEELLSAILADALPEKGPVRLELGTERGLPSLDINIQNGEDLEDALSGSGGAATNLLVAGLRFSALCRTNNRRFIVLDEPDCWLKPEHIPAFVKVLMGVSQQVGTQVIFVSHHDPAYFEGVVNMVQFSFVDKRTTEIQPIEPKLGSWQDETTPGIRSIRLVNFRKFADVTIPLSPGITAFIGDNDLGKSHAAVGALHAVAYGESSDRDIRHQEEEAKIVITLENNVRIEWTRKRKGSPKVTYALYEGDTELHSGPPPSKGQVPEWVKERLGIMRACDLDVQLHSQKKPVFLLDEPASVRAQLLSVGRESERLHALIERYGDLKRKDREIVREGETELAEIEGKLQATECLKSIESDFQHMSATLGGIETYSSRMTAIGKWLSRVKLILDRKNRASAEREVLLALPSSSPDLRDTRELSRTIEKIERSMRVASLRRDYPAVEPPVLMDLKRLADLGNRIAKLKAKASIKRLAPMPDRNVVLNDTETLKKTGLLLSARVSAHQAAIRTLHETENEIKQAHEALAETVKALGGICPTCKGALPEDLTTIPHLHLEGSEV